MPSTFVVWDSKVESLYDPLRHLRDEDPKSFRVLGLPGDSAHGRLWDDAVRPQVAAADRILAFVDTPNANMAFELGYALGLGKPYTLATVHGAPPPWLAESMLRDVLVNVGAEDLGVLLRLLGDSAWAPPLVAGPSGRGARVVLPGTSTASTPRVQLGKGFDARLLLDPPTTIARIAPALAEVGRLAFVLPPSPADKERHGRAVASAAVLAGFASATGRELQVLRSKRAERLVDFVHAEEEWDGDPTPAVRAWLGEDAPAYDRRAVASPRDAIARWREYERHTLDRAVPLLSGAGERLLAEVFVRLDVCELEGRRGVEKLAHGDLTLREFVATARHAALLGEPGAGKTTLLRHLACTLAEEGPVPVFVPLARVTDSGFDPYALAEAWSGISGLRAALLAHDEVWLLLDGMDEVAKGRMASLREQIEAFVRARPGVRAVVSGRPIVDSLRVLPRDFAPARVQPLSPERQKLLVGKLLGETRAAPLVAALERTPALAEMGGNPLLLSLLALVAREARVTDPSFPVRRTELYGTAIDLLLRRGYGVEPRAVWDPVMARDLLRRVSLDLQGEPGESWSRDHIYGRVERVLLGDAELPARLALGFKGSTDDLVTELGTNSGVIGEFEGAGEPWRYLHRSLREHLAAERLRDEGPARIRGWVADWTRAVEAFREAQREGKKGIDPARWGEVHAILCGLSGDPLPLLEELRSVNAPLARRALRSVELEPGRALPWLLQDPQWEYDDVLALAAAHGDGLHRALEAQVRPGAELRVLATGWEVLRWPAERIFAAAELEKGPTPTAVVIQPGEFVMGSPDDLGDDDEHPAHRVRLTRGFRLGVTAVTEDEWAQLTGAAVGRGSRLPAVGMTWYEARLYAVWVGGDLPTEAEWEYACRAGSSGRWCFGDGRQRLADFAWFGGQKRQPVGKKRPNDWGLYDMHGNVWEWCQDGLRAYSGEAVVDPGGGGRGPTVRGGAYSNPADVCRSAFRYARFPRVALEYQGFRVRLPLP